MHHAEEDFQRVLRVNLLRIRGRAVMAGIRRQASGTSELAMPEYRRYCLLHSVHTGLGDVYRNGVAEHCYLKLYVYLQQMLTYTVLRTRAVG